MNDMIIMENQRKSPLTEGLDAGDALLDKSVAKLSDLYWAIAGKKKFNPVRTVASTAVTTVVVSAGTLVVPLVCMGKAIGKGLKTAVENAVADKLDIDVDFDLTDEM